MATNSIKNWIFVSNNLKTQKVLEQAKQVADTNATVLITGESGTGKEIIAHILHANSSRAQNTFLSINCGAICETIQESELFGYVKGSFSGATEYKMGKFEAANHGTIFLDEIGEASQLFQLKIFLTHGTR